MGQDVSHCPPDSNSAPVLRLRPDVKQPELELLKFPDGPYRRHPDEIDEYVPSRLRKLRLDIGMEEHRVAHKKRRKERFEHIRNLQKALPKSERASVLPSIRAFFAIPRLIDSRFLQTSSDEEIEQAIESHFVHCSLYVI
jgi:hypothetical protein